AGLAGAPDAERVPGPPISLLAHLHVEGQLRARGRVGVPGGRQLVEREVRLDRPARDLASDLVLRERPMASFEVGGNRPDLSRESGTGPGQCGGEEGDYFTSLLSARRGGSFGGRGVTLPLAASHSLAAAVSSLLRAASCGASSTEAT